MHRKPNAWVSGLAALRARAILRFGVVLAFLHNLARRGPAAAVAAAGAVALALVLGTATLVGSVGPAAGHLVAADAGLPAADRAGQADRADRSERTGAGADVAATPSPATEPSPAPAVVEAPVVPPPAWVSPLAGSPLSSCYGWRWGALHAGLDFAGAYGTAIAAAGAGTVISAGWLYSGYGVSVLIDHGGGLFTHYAHASRVNVAAGQSVAAGQVIAWEGSTGNSTGPHLHFEVHQGLWQQIDPAGFLRARGVVVGC